MTGSSLPSVEQQLDGYHANMLGAIVGCMLARGYSVTVIHEAVDHAAFLRRALEDGDEGITDAVGRMGLALSDLVPPTEMTTPPEG